MTFDGRQHGVRQCFGPERIAGAWWRGERFVRDYYRLQDESGRWLWVFRERFAGRWFVHGWWS
jgi:protein ImuB